MAYIEGFVGAVPEANKDAYRDHAAEAAPLFEEFGATRMVETWGDDVPEGERTDLRRAVKAEPGEVIVFSWIEYPSREARDAANEKIMSDPRMKEVGDTMPFDGKRMIFGGFEIIGDDGERGQAGYIDGILLPVPANRRDDYRALAARQAALIREQGAMRVVDTWGDDLPDGKITDFKGAVEASEGETVVFSWIEWPSRQVRDAAWPKLMADPRMGPGEDTALFDVQRMAGGGFIPLLDA